jgi:cytochrome c oxidase subunit I+III
MTLTALFLMGSCAILLLGMFNSFLAQTLPMRVPVDTPMLAFARLQYLFWGVGIFLLAALAHLPRAADSVRHDSLSRLGFWLMFLGFNFAFFPTTLRRSHAFLSEPMRLLSAAVGPEVSLGVIMFVAGTVVCVWNYVLLERQARGVDGA